MREVRRTTRCPDGTMVSIGFRLEDGKTIIVNEKEMVIQVGDKSYKVGYDDAIVMNRALRTIMSEERNTMQKEILKLRKTLDCNNCVNAGSKECYESCENYSNYEAAQVVILTPVF